MARDTGSARRANRVMRVTALLPLFLGLAMIVPLFRFLVRVA